MKPPRLRLALATGGALLRLALVTAPALAHGRHVDDEPVLEPAQRLLPALPSRAAQPGVMTFTPKRLYIANDDHTDYMWSGDEAAYRTAFLTMLDHYMAQAETTASYPVDARAKFNCDGSLWVWVYEKNKTPAEFQRLIGHLRAGTITMPLNTCVQLYGAMPAEAVLRSFYYAGALERRFALRFPMVAPQENQTLPGGVASLWAGSGALYSWKGICGCNTIVNAGNRPREIYRFTGPDGASVLMKWNSLYNGMSIGGYAEARNPANAVQLMDSDPTFLSRWPYSSAAAFGYGWDDLQTFTDAFQQASLTLSNASRRVIASNEVDFFQDFDSVYGLDVGHFAGSFGNDWELRTATMAAVTAAFRRSVEKLRTAEALASVAALQDPTFLNGREARRDSAMLACGLFYEHTWGPGPAVSEAAHASWQRRIQRAFAGYVDQLHADALARVASLVSQPSGVERHVVFNPLSWTRTDYADLPASLPEPRHVVDVATGVEVPSQSVVVDGQPRLRILARDVPSVGYRVYEVRAGAGATFPPAASVALPAADNGIYRVALGARGQITSLLDDKDGNRELVDTASGALNDLGLGSGTVTLESSGPVSATLDVAAAGTPPHETRVTLYAGLDRVDVENRITANFGSANQGYASRFDLPGVVMRHEEVGMLARVARAAQGGDYADQNARVDYLTFNHFVDLSQAGRGVTVSNWDAQFFTPGNSTPTVLDTSTPAIRALVGAPVQGPDVGFSGQNGDALFLNRFALRTHGAYDAGDAMRFALEHQNPLVAARLTGGPGGPLPATTWSLLAIDEPDAILWALKPAEEGIDYGLIARVWHVGDQPEAVTLSLPPYGIASAQRTTHVETYVEPANVIGGVLSETLKRQEMATWRLYPNLGPSPVDVGHGGAAELALTAFPNPARADEARFVAYRLPSAGRVRLEVFDLRGARVATLVDGVVEAGSHVARWQADGRRVAPGVYFTRLEAAGKVMRRRVVVLE